jgi:5-methylcytosine-specific restriction endonuclease McrA
VRDHHVVFRSQGGGNERENRITICAWHHLRGVHAGRVRASGAAPHGITWEIGVHAGRRPLIRTDAEGYY